MKYLDNYRKWLDNCDDDGKNELLSIKDNDKEIKERFTLPLAFGTAGMRGTMAYGIANMNVYTVARATKGLADYVNACKAEDRGVVVSYDTRNFSYEFAMTTARVLGAQGVKVFIFENVRPVPMCSFAVRELGAIAGVMITASHNPKEYNGYKVYGEDGAQMSPEATAEVVAYIDKQDYFGIPQESTCVRSRDDVMGKNGVKISEHITVIGKDVDEKYYISGDKMAKWVYLKGAKKIPRKTKEGHEYVFSEGPIAFPDPWDRPGRTMLTSESTLNRSTHTVVDPGTGRIRLLTPVEAERLQGFDDDWTAGMPDRMRYFCMGNALVVPMITRMGHVLDDIIADEE